MCCTCIYPATKKTPNCVCSILAKIPDPSRVWTSQIWVHILGRPLKKSGFLPKTLELWSSAFRAEGKIPFYFCPDHDSEEDLSLQSHSFFEEDLEAAAVTCLAQDIPIFGVWLCLKRQFFIPHPLCSMLCLFYFIFFLSCKSQVLGFCHQFCN